MIELFRQYGWAAVIIAALIVVATHAGLVKLIDMLQENDRKAAATRGEAGQGGGGAAGRAGGEPPAA